MRDVTITLYQFDELDDEAKENARDSMRQSIDLWGWETEWMESRQSFERIAPAKAIRWDLGAGHVDVRWTGDEDVAELEGVRAWKWLNNNGPHGHCIVSEPGCAGSKGNGRMGRYRIHHILPSWIDVAAGESKGACNLTGFAGDAPLFDPIAEIADRPADVPALRDLFEDCMCRWAREAGQDHDHAYSDEGVDEMIEANDYEFTEDGELA